MTTNNPTIEDTPVTETSAVDLNAEDAEVSRIMRRFVAEIVLGVVVGALTLWVLVVSVNDIEFVYQGF